MKKKLIMHSKCIAEEEMRNKKWVSMLVRYHISSNNSSSSIV